MFFGDLKKSTKNVLWSKRIKKICIYTSMYILDEHQ